MLTRPPGTITHVDTSEISPFAKQVQVKNTNKEKGKKNGNG